LYSGAEGTTLTALIDFPDFSGFHVKFKSCAQLQAYQSGRNSMSQEFVSDDEALAMLADIHQLATGDMLHLIFFYSSSLSLLNGNV